MAWKSLVTLVVWQCLLTTAQNFQNVYIGANDGTNSRQSGNIFTVGGNERNIAGQFFNEPAQNFGDFPTSGHIGSAANENFGRGADFHGRGADFDGSSNRKFGNVGNVIGIDTTRVVSPAVILGRPVDMVGQRLNTLKGTLSNGFGRGDASGPALILEAMERFAPSFGGPAIPLGGDNARIRGGIEVSGLAIPKLGPAAVLGDPDGILGGSFVTGPAAAVTGGPAGVLGGRFGTGPAAAVTGGPPGILGGRFGTGPAAVTGGPAGVLGGSFVTGGPVGVLGGRFGTGPAAAVTGGPASVLGDTFGTGPAVTGGLAGVLGGNIGTSPVGQVNRILEAPITPTVTQTITIDRFVTLTDTAFHSVPVTLTDLSVRTVLATTQQVLHTPTNDLVSLERTVVVRPTSVTVTATDTDYRYVTETSVDHVIITHTSYRIKQVTYTTTATRASTHTSTFVRTIVRTQRTTLTEYLTITDAAYAPKPYY
ncbi:uncharacterized protein [Panulirus ornatus]|uniref:uncharacterized protein n=1 Tax=Panulirus ornatus TaxID=150431 RepID=UPI003A89FD69